MSTYLPVNDPLALDLRLPWEVDREQEEKFKRLLIRVVLPFLLFLLVVPWLPVFEAEFVEPESDIVKTEILMEPLVTPTPVPKKEKPQPVRTPKPIKKREPKKVDKKKEAAKKKVSEKTGLTALQSQLSSLQALDTSKLQRKNVSKSKSGKVSRQTKSALGAANLAKKSGGIKVDDAMLKDATGGLASHKSTSLDGFIDGYESGSDEGGAYGSDLTGFRSSESIRRVVEGAKGRVYKFYHNELLNNPDLAGQFLFELVIEPDGSVSSVKLISSDLGVPALEQKMLAQIKKLNFGAEDVPAKTVTYRYNFVPPT